MGVAGLWDVLRPASEVRSLTNIAVVDGFEKNKNGHRGFRLGIDASIWFYHAAYGREGENPELRTMFFRCTRLMGTPFLPLFVFDGDERPGEKRGKRISGKNHWLVQGMQNIIKAFGFEWHMAPGEAEAELAYLNRIDVIDGILSDDVDTFLFGAEYVIRNPSVNLSGNRAHVLKNSAGKNDDQHVATYKAANICTREDIKLSRGGLILIGILRGGDYHQAGLTGCGVTIAHGLAKGGFGDSLYQAARTMDRRQLEDFLVDWRAQVRDELRTNSKGLIGRKNPSLAKSLSEDFPDIDILLSYTRPITSETKGRLKLSRFDWEREPDIGRIAGVCELYFEWGVKEIIVKRFRNFIWPSAVLRVLRRSALLADREEVLTPAHKKTDLRSVGTPSKMIEKHFSSLQLSSPKGDASDKGADNLIIKIHSSRTHASTDHILEYRLEIAPEQLVRFAEGGLRGLRTDVLKNPSDAEGQEGTEEDEDVRKAPADPKAHLRVWVPSCMVEIAEPDLVEEFRAKQDAKREKKRAPKAATRKTKAGNIVTANGSHSQLSPVVHRKPRKVVASSSSEDDFRDKNVLPMLQPEASTNAAKASHFQMAHIADEDLFEVVTKTDAPKATAEKSGRGNDIDAFFKASRGIGHSKAHSTKISKVASLFENVIYADSVDDPPSHRHPKSLHTRAMLQVKNQLPPRSQRILPVLDDAPERIRPGSATVTTGNQAPSLRPFPVNFSDDEEDASSRAQSAPFTVGTSQRRRRQSKESRSSEGPMEKIPKSPRKSRSQISPRRTNTKHSSDDQHERSASIKPLALQPRDIIEISSDSEDESGNEDANRLIPLHDTNATKPSRVQYVPRGELHSREVIDLT